MAKLKKTRHKVILNVAFSDR